MIVVRLPCSRATSSSVTWTSTPGGPTTSRPTCRSARPTARTSRTCPSWSGVFGALGGAGARLRDGRGRLGRRRPDRAQGPGAAGRARDRRGAVHAAPRPAAAGGAAILAVLLVPATWYLGAGWGQLDAVYVALCLWAAILAMHDRRWLFAVVLGLALMTKPQALFLAFPFAGYAIGRWGIRRAALVGLVAAGIAALTWLPFLPYGGIADYLRNLDYYQNGEYPVLSVRAWNPWWLLQGAVAEGSFVLDTTPMLGPLTPRHVGIVLTALAEVVVFWACSAGRRRSGCSWASPPPPSRRSA